MKTTHHTTHGTATALLLAFAAAAGCSDTRETSPAPTAPPPPMSISIISPAQDVTTGGATISITGEKFVDAATGSSVDGVTFAGVAGTNLTVVSPTLLTVDAPANPAGAADVVLTNSTTTESVTETAGFAYFNGTPSAPTVTGVTPSGGPAAGGVPITISGSNFVATGMTVTVGGAAATNLVLLSGGRIRVVLPPGTAGPANIVVNNGGGSATLTNGFVYLGSGPAPAPSVTTVTPGTGSFLGGTLVTINGSGFVSTSTSKPSVNFATGAATAVTVLHAGALTCITPSGPNGLVNVSVTNPGGNTGTLNNGFNYFTPSPSISGFVPPSGPVSIQHTVTIQGSNFFPGVTVTMGGLAATVNTSLLTLNQIVVITPAGVASGSQPVVVTNTSGSPPTASSSYTFNPPPTYSSVNPTTGSTLGGTAVTVFGTNFTTSVSVLIGPGFLSSPTVQAGGTEIVGTTPAGSAGTYDITVTNSDGQSVSTSGGVFTFVPPPQISNINPAFDVTTGGATVTITGQDFQTSPTNPTVEFNTGNFGTVTLATSTSIEVTVPSTPLGPPGTGTVNIIVTNADGQSTTLANGFTYSNTPNPTSTTPASPVVDTLGNNPGTMTTAVVTINGSNFLAGATVQFGIGNLAGISSITSTQIVVTAPASASTGQVDIIVTNPGGFTGTITNGVTYVADVNFQTRQYVFDTSTGIDCRRRWYVNMNFQSFIKDMQNRGLQTWGTPGDTTAPPALSALNATDQYALDWMRAYVLRTLNVAYGRNPDGSKISGSSINITFVGLPPSTGARGCSNAATDWGEMAIGGCDPTGGGGPHPSASQNNCNTSTVGRASYDTPNPTACNSFAEWNANTTYHACAGCSTQRGTFSGNISTSWGRALTGGQLSHPGDQQYLDGSTTSGTRYNNIHQQLQIFARRIAFVTAHEIGHSLGLAAQSTTGNCNNSSGHCGSTSSHNNCCTGPGGNIMSAVVSWGGSTNPSSDTAYGFSGNPNGPTSSTSCWSSAQPSSWASLQAFCGTSP